MVLLARWDGRRGGAHRAPPLLVLRCPDAVSATTCVEHAERAVKRLSPACATCCAAAHRCRCRSCRARAAPAAARSRPPTTAARNAAALTTCPPDAPLEQKVLTTDGRPLPGTEVRLDGSELLVRGPQLALGYRGGDPSARFRADGWFATGDEARSTPRLGAHHRPALRPDPPRRRRRLADRGRGGARGPPRRPRGRRRRRRRRAARGAGAVAVVVPRAPRCRDIDALRALCDESGLAKVKWPEAVFPVEKLPRRPPASCCAADPRRNGRARDDAAGRRRAVHRRRARRRPPQSARRSSSGSARGSPDDPSEHHEVALLDAAPDSAGSAIACVFEQHRLDTGDLVASESTAQAALGYGDYIADGRDRAPASGPTSAPALTGFCAAQAMLAQLLRPSTRARDRPSRSCARCRR